MIQSNSPAGRTLQVTIGATGLDIHLVPLAGHSNTLSISDLGNGLTAKQLGIAGNSPAGSIVGGALNPTISLTTPLAALYGGAGIDTDLRTANRRQRQDANRQPRRLPDDSRRVERVEQLGRGPGGPNQFQQDRLGGPFQPERLRLLHRRERRPDRHGPRPADLRSKHPAVGPELRRRRRRGPRRFPVLHRRRRRRHKLRREHRGPLHRRPGHEPNRRLVRRKSECRAFPDRQWPDADRRHHFPRNGLRHGRLEEHCGRRSRPDSQRSDDRLGFHQRVRQRDGRLGTSEQQPAHSIENGGNGRQRADHLPEQPQLRPPRLQRVPGNLDLQHRQRRHHRQPTRSGGGHGPGGCRRSERILRKPRHVPGHKRRQRDALRARFSLPDRFTPREARSRG